MSISQVSGTSLTDNKSENKLQDKVQSTSSFSDVLMQSEEAQEKAKNKEIREAMIADILSMIKTGLTVSELEKLQELLAQINDLLTGDENDSETNKEIETMLSKLEVEVLALQKRVTGSSILEKDDKEEKVTDEEKSISGNSIDSRIENVTKSIDNLISAKLAEDDIFDELLNENEFKTNDIKFDKSEYMTDEELRLKEKLTK